MTRYASETYSSIADFHIRIGKPVDDDGAQAGQESREREGRGGRVAVLNAVDKAGEGLVVALSDLVDQMAGGGVASVELVEFRQELAGRTGRNVRGGGGTQLCHPVNVRAGRHGSRHDRRRRSGRDVTRLVHGS